MVTTDDVPMNSDTMDYAEHERTYRAFTTGTKWAGMAIALIMILMAFFLL